MNYGMNVKITFKKKSVYKGAVEVCHNVTEIHYSFPSVTGLRSATAFESDIHGTGCNYMNEDIKEFEATIAKKKEANF